MTSLADIDLTELEAAVLSRLQADPRNFFAQAADTTVQAFVVQVLQAFRQDAEQQQIKQLRKVLNRHIPRFVDWGMLFSDLRFYVTAIRVLLLETMLAHAPTERAFVEDWCHELGITSALYYTAQREATISDQQAQMELQYSELRALHQAQQEARALLSEIWVPIVSVYAGVLLIPLVGSINVQRADELTERLLITIQASTVRFVILDITGVRVIDTHIAQALLQMAKAITLLGAEMIIVGIVPEIAQTIVQLGLNLSSITTYGSLSDGLQVALNRLGVYMHTPL